MLIRKLILSIFLYAMLTCLVLGCVSGGDALPILQPSYSEEMEEFDIGAVTFFTRMKTKLSDKDMKLLLDVYKNYGAVSLEWVDDKKQQLDVLVKGAPIEWGSSFVQENIELAQNKLINWRLDEVWYRSDFQLYTVSFPYRGTVNADAKFYIDYGLGFEEVQLNRDGSFEVLLPFSHQKTIIFTKTELGDVSLIRKINILGGYDEQISEEQYLNERTILAAEYHSDDDATSERIKFEDYVFPDIPEPEISIGDSGKWFEIDKENEPVIEGFLKPEDEPKEDETPDEIETQEPEEEVIAEQPIILPKRKGNPPKNLLSSVPINVYLIFSGIEFDEAGEKILAAITNTLYGFGYPESYYNDQLKAQIYKLIVYEISDIKRIHIEIDKLSQSEGLLISNPSKNFGVKMTPLFSETMLRTKIRGNVLPGSEISIYLGKNQPEQKSMSDSSGNFTVEVDLPRGSTYLYGTMLLPSKELRFFQVSVLTGKITEITKEQYEQAILVIDERSIAD